MMSFAPPLTAMPAPSMKSHAWAPTDDSGMRGGQLAWQCHATKTKRKPLAAHLLQAPPQPPAAGSQPRTPVKRFARAMCMWLAALQAWTALFQLAAMGNSTARTCSSAIHAAM